MLTQKEGRLLHVSFTVVFLSPEDQQAIESVLSTGWDWLRYGSNCWLLFASEPPATWVEKLMPINSAMRGSFGFLVTEFDDYAGMLDQRVWDWLNRKNP